MEKITKCILYAKSNKVQIHLETFQYLNVNISVTMGEAKCPQTHNQKVRSYKPKLQLRLNRPLFSFLLYL